MTPTVAARTPQSSTPSLRDRLKDASLYPEWFGQAHSAPETLPDWTYGLPELHREEIKTARAIANPGCYPTAAILALAPLVSSGLVDPAQ